MNPIRPVLRLALPAAMLFLPHLVSAQLSNYWPITEAGGGTTGNVAGGAVGTLFNGATFVTDATRGQVLEFNGAGSYVNAGTIPALGLNSDFTWAFWANSSQGPNSNVIVGNRYSPTSGVDFVPREFIKFTPSAFEWHRNGAGENLDYPDIAVSTWNYFTVTKRGNMLISYRNGLIDRTGFITAGLNNPQPFYFGGDQNLESWAGRLDDVATWTTALPSTSVIGLAKGNLTPQNAPTSGSGPSLSTIFSDGFSSGLGNWTNTTRGLENNAPVGYNPAVINGSSQLVLGGTTNNQYWFGNSLESVALYDATKVTEVSVDRISLSGTGSAYRSSLWVLGDDGHYLHFSQNFGESGWSFNARDDGGQGTNNPTGGGVDITSLNGLDGDLGQHSMKIRLEPTGDPGDINMFLYFDGSLVGAQGFSNFTPNFRVVLTGQGRAIGDSVDATFDNVLVQQVPEPGSAALLLAGAVLFAARRRKSCS